ncbi:MFS transporter [Megasphaera sp.]|uniref:MFS transporter n=2 Tax=Megasphaera TaxID=906 RepID=UPI0025DAFF5C|nr:MFS transporter [uncultured Megasphaera sp.]
MTTEKRIFYSICLISFVGPFLSTSINIALPVMAGQFGVAPDKMSWVVTIFLMTTAAFLLPLGKVSDVHGRRRTYCWSLIVFAIATAAAAAAPTLPVLIGLRALQGIALAGVYVSYMPLLLATTDEDHQGHILGKAVALTYLGLSLGPVIGGALTQFVGWRCIFLFSAIAIFISYNLIRPIKEEWYANGAPFVNLVSSALCISGIILALYGLSSFDDYGTFFFAGLVILGIFIIHEGKSFHPLLPLYLFRNLTFSMSNLAALIQYSSTYAVSFLLSLYFQLILGLSPALSGAILLVQPIIMAFLSPKAGDLSDKYGPRGIASLGLLLTAMGLTAFALFPHVPIGGAAVFLIFIGLGAALFGAPNNSAIMGSVKKMHHGIASSILALSRNLGQALSMAVVTFIMTTETAKYASYAEGVVAALHLSFIILAVLCFLAVAASLARGRNHEKV